MLTPRIVPGLGRSRPTCQDRARDQASSRALACPSCAPRAVLLRKDGGASSDAQTVDGFPAYVTTNDEKGAQSFARYWIDTLNKATTSGDTKKLEEAQQGSCTTCADFAKQLDDIYGAGGHVETDGFKVKKILNEAGVPGPRRRASAWC